MFHATTPAPYNSTYEGGGCVSTSRRRFETRRKEEAICSRMKHKQITDSRLQMYLRNRNVYAVLQYVEITLYGCNLKHQHTWLFSICPWDVKSWPFGSDRSTLANTDEWTWRRCYAAPPYFYVMGGYKWFLSQSKPFGSPSHHYKNSVQKRFLTQTSSVTSLPHCISMHVESIILHENEGFPERGLYHW